MLKGAWMKHLLTGIPHTLEVSIDGEDGPLALSAAPTAVLRGPDGSLTPSLTVTGTGTPYSVSVPSTANSGVYGLDLTGTLDTGETVTQTRYVEFVGTHLFTLAELRASDEAIADTARYTDDYLAGIRDSVDDEFTRICNRALTVHGYEETVNLFDGRFYLLEFDPIEVYSAQVDGTAIDPTTLSLEPTGEGTYSGTGDSLTIYYAYGLRSVPNDIKRAAIIRARGLAYSVDSGIPDRATSFQMGEGGFFSLATAGKNGSETGIPDVDAILRRYTLRYPGVA